MKKVFRGSLIATIILGLLVLGISCSLTSAPAPSKTPVPAPVSDYTETELTLVVGEIGRLTTFANEGSTIKAYFKADICVYYWYTDNFGRALPLYDYGKGPQGERVIGVREPVSPDDVPQLRIADANGHYLYDDPMDCGTGHDVQVKASQAGYYTFCFMPAQNQTANVIVRYLVE